jgi:hypothetical protein
MQRAEGTGQKPGEIEDANAFEKLNHGSSLRKPLRAGSARV